MKRCTSYHILAWAKHMYIIHFRNVKQIYLLCSKCLRNTHSTNCSTYSATFLPKSSTISFIKHSLTFQYDLLISTAERYFKTQKNNKKIHIRYDFFQQRITSYFNQMFGILIETFDNSISTSLKLSLNVIVEK